MTLGSSFEGCFVILYADDILLLSPSVSQLESLLRVCERELACLDMAINFKKSCCIQIGPRRYGSVKLIENGAIQ